MNGHGIFTGADGHRYGGGFQDGCLHGRGVYEQKDGRRYEGEFERNKRKGQGVQRYADGAVYEGEWKNDRRHGRGTYQSKKGVPYKYVGAWKDGERHGKGKMDLPDKQKFDGSYIEGRPQPGGTYTFADRTKTVFTIDPRFESYLGPGSNPAAYEVPATPSPPSLTPPRVAGGKGEDPKIPTRWPPLPPTHPQTLTPPAHRPPSTVHRPPLSVAPRSDGDDQAHGTLEAHPG